jgi:hypothetical protein
MDWFDWVTDLLDFLAKHWGVVWRVAVVVLGLAVCCAVVYLIGRALNLF